MHADEAIRRGFRQAQPSSAHCRSAPLAALRGANGGARRGRRFSQVYISGVSEGSRARTVFFDVDLYWTSAILLPILRKLYESPNRLAP